MVQESDSDLGGGWVSYSAKILEEGWLNWINPVSFIMVKPVVTAI